MSWTDLIVYDGEVDEVEYDGDHDGGDEGGAPAGGELAHAGAGPVPHQRGHVVVLGVADTVPIIGELEQGGDIFHDNWNWLVIYIVTDLKTLRLELALLTQALVVSQPGQRGHPLLEQPGRWVQGSSYGIGTLVHNVNNLQAACRQALSTSFQREKDCENFVLIFSIRSDKFTSPSHYHVVFTPH